MENLVPTDKRICPECGCEMPTLGFSCCEQIEIIPAKIVVIERRDETVACANDDCIVSAAPPAQIVPKGKLGPTLIIEALADKYVEHQPIERQCVRFARAGVDIAPQTLGRAVAAAIDWMMPLAALIKERTSAPGLLGTDATSIPVLDRDAPEGIRLGTMWAWTNGKFVTFVYARSGDSDSVRSFLGDNIARTIQCDGSSVLRFVERAGGKLPGCWSHGRRRFIRAARGGDKLALEGVKIIDEIFAVERTAKAEGDDVEQIAARRRAYTKPILDKIRGWVDEHRPLIPPKTPLGKALGYMHRQWKRLELFIDDGRIESTNNRRERELRRLVLGRKNWLFVWGDLGGERAACALTVMASCVAHGVNPRAYLHRVIPLLVRGVTDDELVELLPDRITARYPELVPPPREPPRERLLPAPA